MSVRKITPWFGETDLDQMREYFELPYVEKPYEVGILAEDHPSTTFYYALWHSEPTFKPYEERRRAARQS